MGMHKKLLFLLLFFSNISFLFSQKNEEVGVLFQKSEEALFRNPEQCLKITNHIVHNSTTPNELAQAYLLLSKSYFTSGKFMLAAENILLANQQAEQSSEKDIYIESLLFSSEIYNFLGLYEVANQHSEKAKMVAQKDKKLEERVKTYLYFNTPDNKHKRTDSNLTNELNYSFLSKGTIQTQLATEYLSQSKLDSALVYFQKSIDNNKAINVGSYWEMITALHFSNYFFAKKEYQNAIEQLNLAIEKGKLFSNDYFQESIYEKLSKNYLVTNNIIKYRELNQKAMTSGSNVSTELTLATNYVIEQLHKVNEEKIDKARTFQNNINWILATIASVLLLGWLFMKWLFATRIQYMIDIISYLKLIHNSETKTEINERVLLKSISKPKEIEELLLTKLTKFETGEKFLNKDMSLALLASQLDTNTKYLSEVINKYKGKNFNVYINELRINYIVSKLKTNPMYLNYKVSYLADECGFSSHSSFSTVFKNCTGIKPNVFIQFLMKDRNENNKSSAA